MNKLKVGDKAIYEGREVEITLIKDGYCVGWRRGNSGGLDHINLFSPLPIIAPKVQGSDTTTDAHRYDAGNQINLIP